jgi:hypothetical protein
MTCQIKISHHSLSWLLQMSFQALLYVLDKFQAHSQTIHVHMKAHPLVVDEHWLTLVSLVLGSNAGNADWMKSHDLVSTGADATHLTPALRELDPATVTLSLGYHLPALWDIPVSETNPVHPPTSDISDELLNISSSPTTLWVNRRRHINIF